MKLFAAIATTMLYIGMTMAAILAIFRQDVTDSILYGAGAIAWGFHCAEAIRKVVDG
jgi:hypothetical protein